MSLWGQRYIWTLSFLASGQTVIYRCFLLHFHCVLAQWWKPWFTGEWNSLGQRIQSVEPQKLYLNFGVCADVHFSGDRAHNFHQIETRVSWHLIPKKIKNRGSQNQWPLRILNHIVHLEYSFVYCLLYNSMSLFYVLNMYVYGIYMILLPANSLLLLARG